MAHRKIIHQHRNMFQFTKREILEKKNNMVSVVVEISL